KHGTTWTLPRSRSSAQATAASCQSSPPQNSPTTGPQPKQSSESQTGEKCTTYQTQHSAASSNDTSANPKTTPSSTQTAHPSTSPTISKPRSSSGTVETTAAAHYSQSRSLPTGSTCSARSTR